jgi:hypothetical protein
MECKHCLKTFARIDNLTRHLRVQHQEDARSRKRKQLNIKPTAEPLTRRASAQPPPQAEAQETRALDSHGPYLDYKQFPLYDYSLRAPFSMVISGMPSSGKSTLTGELLRRRREVILTKNGKPIDKIMYCYAEHQPAFFHQLKKDIPQIVFHHGLPDEYGEDEPSIVVLDDLMHEASKSNEALAAFTRGSHHRNICLVILVQNFFHKNLRGITSSCHYMCFMKNPRDSASVYCLGRQMNGGRRNVCLELAYQDAMTNPYGYLFIDCSQHQDDKFRLRNSIFPQECTVYAPK